MRLLGNAGGSVLTLDFYALGPDARNVAARVIAVAGTGAEEAGVRVGDGVEDAGPAAALDQDGRRVESVLSCKVLGRGEGVRRGTHPVFHSGDAALDETAQREWAVGRGQQRFEDGEQQPLGAPAGFQLGLQSLDRTAERAVEGGMQCPEPGADR